MNTRNSTNTQGKWLALVAIGLVGLATGLDLTVLNTALPTLAGALSASNSQLQWFVDAYTLSLSVVLLPAGLVGDRFGRKKLMMGGLLLFGVASLGCGLSTSSTELIAFRVVLGVGAGCVLTLSVAVIPVLFTVAERPKAMAVVAMTAFVSYPVGPILGGWLLTHASWGAVFFINLPVIALGLVALWRFMPESRGSERTPLDPLGLVLSSLGLGLIVYGAIEAGEIGWASAGTIACLAGGILVLTAFVAWERAGNKKGTAGVDFRIFRSANFTWGTILATVLGFSLFAVMYVVPQLFQAVLGMDAQETGFRFLPMIGGLILGLGFSTRLMNIVGPKVLAAAGFLVCASGFFIATFTTLYTPEIFILTWLGIVGAGIGLVMPSMMNAALSGLSVDRAGSGSAVLKAVQNVGGTIGVAIIGTIMNGTYRDHLDLAGLPSNVVEVVRKSVMGGLAVAHKLSSPELGDSVRGAFSSGMALSLWVSTSIALASFILAIVFLPGKSVAKATERGVVSNNA